MIVIDGFWWFVGALMGCGWHTIFMIWPWRRELRRSDAWWRKYDADARERHETFMAAIRTEDRASGVDELDRECCPSCGHELSCDDELLPATVAFTTEPAP